MATKEQVNTAAENFIADTETADSKINGLPGFVTDRHGVTTKNLEKIFQDATDINSKDPVKAWADSNLSLSDSAKVDGVVLSIGDRVGVGNQTDPTENGVYIYSDSAWSRSSDMNSDSDIHSSHVFVNDGTNYIGHTYRFIVTDPDQFSLESDSIFAYKVGDATLSEYPPVTQAEAEAATDSDLKSWSPLRVGQAIRSVGDGRYDEVWIPFGKDGTLDSAEVLEHHLIPYGWEIPADLANSGFYAGTGATNLPAVFQIVHANTDTVYGTISYDSASSITFSTTGGVAHQFSAGDRIKIIGPAPADATLADVVATIVLKRTEF